MHGYGPDLITALNNVDNSNTIPGLEGEEALALVKFLNFSSFAVITLVAALDVHPAQLERIDTVIDNLEKMGKNLDTPRSKKHLDKEISELKILRKEYEKTIYSLQKNIEKNPSKLGLSDIKNWFASILPHEDIQNIDKRVSK